MSEHGHNILGKYIINNFKPEELINKTIIEIGSVREFLDGQNSTDYFTKLCKKYNMNLVSIDMDIECTNNAIKVFKDNNFENGEAINKRGEEYFKDLGFYSKLNFVYLDGYDYDHQQHAEERQESYNRVFGTDINNEECWASHLDMVKEIHLKSDIKTVVCFDDIISSDVGKGVTAIPYLFDNGWVMREYKNRAVIMKLPEIWTDKSEIDEIIDNQFVWA